MVAVQIRGVSEEDRDALAQDAAARGQSLQAYLRDVLDLQVAIARNRALLRTFEPIEGTGDGPAVDVAALIRRQRLERERHLVAMATGEDE